MRMSYSTRSEFTQEDDDMLARYFAHVDPLAKGWKGQAFYDRLVGLTGCTVAVQAS